MGVDNLFELTRSLHGGDPHFSWLTHWQDKKRNAFLAVSDLDDLIEQYNQSNKNAVPVGDNGYRFDAKPRMRIAFTVEGIANSLYGMSEIAVKIASQCSRKSGYINLPTSFHKFIKKTGNGEYRDLQYISLIPTFEWYNKLRELRTELAHHSSVFIGGRIDSSSPTIVIECQRNIGDKKEYKEKVVFTIPEFKALAIRAVATLDAFADFIAYQFVIPYLNMDQSVVHFKIDEYGIPLIENGKLATYPTKLPMRLHIINCGYNCSTGGD